jgi:hypothetical protein
LIVCKDFLIRVHIWKQKLLLGHFKLFIFIVKIYVRIEATAGTINLDWGHIEIRDQTLLSVKLPSAKIYLMVGLVINHCLSY